MGSGDTLTVNLTGGGPWGFRLMGGDKFPIQIAKIRKKSKASLAGLQEGDSIISINGVSVVGKSHEDAMHHVDNSGDTITIEVQRSGGKPQLQEASSSVPQITAVNDSSQPVVSTTSTSYTLNGDNVRTDVVKTQHHEATEDGTERKSFMTQQVTNVSSDGVQPSSVTKQKIQVSFSEQTEQGKENIAPMIGIFAQNKWNKVPQFNIRNVKNTLKPAIQGNIQTRQHSPSPVPTPSVFRPSSPAKEPQEFKIASSTVMRPMSPAAFQIRQSSPLPASPSMMSPQLRQPSPVPTPTKFVPATPVQSSFQPAPPQSLPLPKNIAESELYFEVPKPKMPKVVAHFENDEVDAYPVLTAELDEHHHHQDHHEHLPIFAPPVEFYPEDFGFGFPDTPLSEEAPDLEMRRVMSLESEGSSDYGMSAANRTRRRKLYSDSAFYDDPTANYPTIREQIDLCKKIAKSLTSAANRKARGARMFAKRKHKSSRWIHDGEHHDSYSAGDVEDLVDLDTEIFIEEGGTRPLFSFRIPNIKKRIGNPDVNIKMSLTQDQFERLRLGSQKSDHRAVSPSTCHSLVADLHSKKNRGARLFQKRQARSEKWVIDESNAKKAPLSPPTKLETMLSPSGKPMSPWDAAMQNPIGSVDAAFANRQRQEQLQKYKQPAPPPQHFAHPVSAPYQQPKQQVVKHNLRTEEQMNMITGPNYNRMPKGWGQADDVVDTRSLDRKVMRSQERTFKQEQPPPPPPPPKPLKQQDNYNRKIKAWGCKDDDGVQSSWSSSQNVQYEPYSGGQGQPQGYRMTNSYSYQSSSQQPMMSQEPMMLPGSDL